MPLEDQIDQDDRQNGDQNPSTEDSPTSTILTLKIHQSQRDCGPFFRMDKNKRHNELL